MSHIWKVSISFENCACASSEKQCRPGCVLIFTKANISRCWPRLIHRHNNTSRTKFYIQWLGFIFSIRDYTHSARAPRSCDDLSTSRGSQWASQVHTQLSSNCVLFSSISYFSSFQTMSMWVTWRWRSEWVHVTRGNSAFVDFSACEKHLFIETG